MMDASSTVLAVAKLLKERKRITVITNSVEALIELSDSKEIKVISTGGVLRESSLSLAGRNAEAVINQYNVDKAIISCKGIDLEKAATDSSEQEVEIKRAMCRAAKQTILAVDSNKFNRVAFTRLLDFEEIDLLVTDTEPDKKWMTYLEGTHMQVIY
jgi:DeoR/GlpR family transcriptional regulator of sugar metabolism